MNRHSQIQGINGIACDTYYSNGYIQISVDFADGDKWHKGIYSVMGDDKGLVCMEGKQDNSMVILAMQDIVKQKHVQQSLAAAGAALAGYMSYIAGGTVGEVVPYIDAKQLESTMLEHRQGRGILLDQDRRYSRQERNNHTTLAERLTAAKEQCARQQHDQPAPRHDRGMER